MKIPNNLNISNTWVFLFKNDTLLFLLILDFKWIGDFINVHILRYFKTCYSFDIRRHNLTGYFYHLNKTLDKPASHICQFGQDGCFVLALYLIYRLYKYCQNKTVNKIFNTILLVK